MLLVTLLLAPAAAYVAPGAGVSGEGSPKLGVPFVEVLTYYIYIQLLIVKSTDYRMLGDIQGPLS